MILDDLDWNISTPDEWENLCDKCYSIRYKGKWHKVPATCLGDCGIEGFTDDGVVYQCYFPEKVFSDNELYIHQRDKLTKDLNKMTDAANVQRLKKILGRVVIKEWHLVIPEYKDKKIIEHANEKETEILELINDDPSAYPHLDKALKVSVMQADSYILELAELRRALNKQIGLRLDLDKDIDYSKCETDKVENIRRKMRAIQPKISNVALDKTVNIYIKRYMDGIARLNKLRIDLPSEYADIHKIINAFKDDVEAKTLLNGESSMNKKIFDDILEEFKNELEKLRIFTQDTIINLKNEIISGWLADCSMEFSTS